MYEADVVDIVDPITDEVVNHCLGPAVTGGCPWVSKDGVVLCDGHLVSSAGAGPEYWRLWVPPESRHCPRAWSLEGVGY